MSNKINVDGQNIIIASVGILGVLCLACWGKHWHAQEVASVIVLWLTGIAIFWNTNESRRLRLETQLATLQPHLKLELSPKHGSILQVSNIGKGIARTVHLEPFLIIRDTTQSIGFKGVQSLAPGELILLESTNKVNDDEAIKPQLIKSIEAGTLDDLLITYCDSANWLYEAKFRGRKDYRRGFEDLGPQKRVRRIVKT